MRERADHAAGMGTRLWRRVRLGAIAATAVVFLLTLPVSGTAAPTAVDVQLDIGAGQSRERPNLTPNGGTATVASRNFYVFLSASLITPQQATAKVRFELGGGLQWGADNPDPTEGCTSTPTSGECQPALEPIQGRSSADWYWTVVAPQDGQYTFKAEIVEASDSDPVPSNNSSSITIVVAEAAEGGGGGSAATSASTARLSPAKPTAGSRVTASVRVTSGGAPVRPTKILCAATIGKARLKGTAKAALGSAACVYRTSKAARGRTLRGTVSFTVAGERFGRPLRQNSASDALWRFSAQRARKPAPSRAREPGSSPRYASDSQPCGTGRA